MNNYSIDVKKEECRKIAEWLNEKNRAVEQSVHHTDKMTNNSKYTGVIKFIDKIGGKVVYKPKNNHIVTLNEIPIITCIEGFTTRQTQGVCELLISLKHYPAIEGTNLKVYY